MRIATERKVHWLRRNAGERAPHNLVFVDTEPTRWHTGEGGKFERHTLMLGVATHIRLDARKQEHLDRIIFYRAEDFWAWLTKWANPKHALWIFGHHLAYDFTLLGGWELLDDGYLHLHWDGSKPPAARTNAPGADFRGFLCLADNPFIIICKQQWQTYRFVDTRNYWPMPLAKLAESLSMKQLPLPGDAAERDELENYCRQNVRVLTRAVCELIHMWKERALGEFGLTAASLAWHAFRHKFMAPRSILIDECEPARDLERLALCGGECRCHYVGKVLPAAEREPGTLQPTLPPTHSPREGPVYCLDAQSFYGSVMRDNYFPRRLIAYRQKGSTEDLDQWRKYLCIIATVRVNTSTNVYPVLVDGERWYCQGSFWTTLCGPELLRARDAGEIAGWGPIAAYERGLIFRRFVDYFWGMRQGEINAGRPAGDLLAKMLLVALPGKFAQRNARWQDTGRTVSEPRWGVFPLVVDGKPSPLSRRVIGGYVQQETAPDETPDSFPAVTAYVNSYARIRLNELRLIAGPEHVLYTHTDSLHVDQAGFDRLVDAAQIGDGQLGKLRLVVTAQRAEYRGLNDYTFDGVNLVAGLPGNAKEDRPGHFITQLWEGPESIVARGPDRTVTVATSEFRIGRSHPKGMVTDSGAVLPAMLVGGELLTDIHKAAHRPRSKRQQRKRDAE